MTPTPELTAPLPLSTRQKLKDFWDRNWVTITIVSMLCLLVVAYLADRIFISVQPGQAMVMFERFERDAIPNEVYFEGFYIIAPWNEAYKYDIRYHQQTVPVIALTRNGLSVTVDCSITYRPVAFLLPHLHRRYGQGYIEKLVLPQLRAAIQDIVGQFDPEQIYGLARSAQHEQIFERAHRIIGGVYVEIDDVSILDVKLPERVQSAIQAKLEEQQVVQLYDYRVQAAKKEAERKLEEAKGIQAFQNTISKGITDGVLEWKGIEATLELAKSPNAKIVVVGAGAGKAGLPLILGDVQPGK